MGSRVEREEMPHIWHVMYTKNRGEKERRRKV